jgi:hypothetical protein
MRFLGLLMAAALSACGVTIDDSAGSNGKADGDGTCTDPHYGDGTCQVDLACGIPDVDCFVTFATDAEAATWATMRWPSTTVAETDPVFARARTLLDRAWALYRAEVQLGKLAEKRVAAVVFEDPELNAFAMADGAPGMAGLSVQMNRGLFTSALTDDEIVGVLLHELTHVVKLHVLDEVYEKTRRFYIATSPEPLGSVAPEIERAKQAGVAWRTAAAFVGIVSDPVLDALPLDGNLGGLFDNYWGDCNAAVSSVRAATGSIAYDRLTGGYALPSDLAVQLAPALAALRTCAAGEPISLRTWLAQLDPTWTDYMTTQLAADEQSLLEQPRLEATLALAAKRRAALRAIETDFTAATGAPWSALRFFSTEEEADDYAARIAAHQHLATEGSAAPSVAYLAETKPVCEAAIAAGTTPYGQRLTDDHHGDCWRLMHARQVMAAASAPTETTARTAAPTPWTPSRVQRPRPMY